MDVNLLPGAKLIDCRDPVTNAKLPIVVTFAGMTIELTLAP